MVLVTLPILGDVLDAILRLVSGEEGKVREEKEEKCDSFLTRYPDEERNV